MLSGDLKSSTEVVYQILEETIQTVTGGLIWNFPVNLFDHQQYLSAPDKGKSVAYSVQPGYVFNTETLGIRLDTTKELALTGRAPCSLMWARRSALLISI